MNLFYAVLLGIIQGLTEFLPISSTAHLTIAGKVFGLIDPVKPEDWTAFIAVMQLGTVAAVIIYFFRDLMAMLRAVVSDARPETGTIRWSPDSRLAGQIAVGTIPVVILGLVLKKVIEGNLTKSLTVIGCSLVVLAMILFWAEKVGRRNRDLSGTTWKDAFLVGLAQACALIPGSSRSGTTITAGLFLGLTREAAARFSFLLSIPAVVASGLFEFFSARRHLDGAGLPALALSTIVAGVVGYAAIALLLRYLKTHSTMVFVVYRVALGLLLLTIAARAVP